MKKSCFIALLLIASTAHATSIDALIQQHGKKTIMLLIAPKIGKKFTIEINGQTEQANMPSPEFVTAETLATDIARAGLTVDAIAQQFAADKKAQQDLDKKIAERDAAEAAITPEQREAQRKQDLAEKQKKLAAMREEQQFKYQLPENPEHKQLQQQAQQQREAYIAVYGKLPDPIPTPAPAAPTEPKPAQQNQPRHAQPAEQCQQDIKCIGSELLINAMTDCKPAIERLSKYQFKWLDGIFTKTFAAYTWADTAHTAVHYFGDKLQFQNGFGAWQNIIYHCDIRVADGQMVKISAAPGRL